MRTVVVAVILAGACSHTPDAAEVDATEGEGDSASEPSPSEAEPAEGSVRIDVTTVAEFLAALGSAQPGTLIYVADGASLDLTGKTNIVVPERVTIASGHGRDYHAGALLFTTQLDTMPLFVVKGAGVHFTGLRLRGPDPNVGSTPYGTPLADGISATHADNLQVDHCELSGWSHAAISLDYAHRAYVHHNNIHHNQRTGLGYGIVLIHEADALIERNTFDYNRHAIAGTGRAGLSYEARYNLVGPHRIGHAFDMHGENETVHDGSPNAGDLIEIHHNTFQGTGEGFRLRGRPRIGAYVDHNCFAASEAAGTAITQVFFFGNLFVSNNLYGQSAGTCHTGAAAGRSIRGDITGDGYADVVTFARGNAYTYLGAPNGKLRALPPQFHGTLDTALFDATGHLAIDIADVDNDGYADLITAASDGNVDVYPGGLGGWFGGAVPSFHGTYPVGPTGFEPIAVADVNGDGYADLISQRDGTVYVHPGRADRTFGSSVASFAGTFRSGRYDGTGHLAVDVADVTGDGRADLVSISGGTAYVYPGTATGAFGGAVASFHGTYHDALVDGAGFEPVGLADVDGDGRADLVSAHIDGTVYVFRGTATGAFTGSVASFAGTLPTSTFGGTGSEVIAALDITGDGRADLVAADRNGHLVVWPGTATGAFTSAVTSFDDASYHSSRFGMLGHEAASEKSVLRRRGCQTSGCF